MFGDPLGVNDAYLGKEQGLYRKSAYYKAWHWCSTHGSVVYLDYVDDDETLRN